MPPKKRGRKKTKAKQQISQSQDKLISNGNTNKNICPQKSGPVPFAAMARLAMMMI